MKTRAHHIDLEDSSGVVFVCSGEERTRIQIEMINDFRVLLSLESNRYIDENEAVLNWIRLGLAEKFARKYKIKKRNQRKNETL